MFGNFFSETTIVVKIKELLGFVSCILQKKLKNNRKFLKRHMVDSSDLGKGIWSVMLGGKKSNKYVYGMKNLKKN